SFSGGSGPLLSSPFALPCGCGSVFTPFAVAGGSPPSLPGSFACVGIGVSMPLGPPAFAPDSGLPLRPPPLPPAPVALAPSLRSPFDASLSAFFFASPSSFAPPDEPDLSPLPLAPPESPGDSGGLSFGFASLFGGPSFADALL